MLKWYFCCGAGIDEKYEVLDQLPTLDELYTWRTVESNEQNQVSQGRRTDDMSL